MATFGDFSSLLQLGVGTGIGLSLFRAPVDLRVGRISRSIESELTAMRSPHNEFVRKKRRDMQDLKISFAAKRDTLDRHMLPFMFAAVVGAILNLIGLVGATIEADQVLSSYKIYGLLLLTIGWFAIELAVLEVLARSQLHSFGHKLQELRSRRAPPFEVPNMP